MLFNRFIRGLLPKINRISIIYDYDDEHYDALKQRQHLADRRDTGKDFTTIPVASAEVVHRKDNSPLIHSIVLDHGTKEHSNRSYKICIMKQAMSSAEQPDL